MLKNWGGYKDWDTGFTYFWHRWYDSSIGRWINRDPIGIEGGINVYKYVEGNPVNQIDVMGLCPPDELGCFWDIFMPCLSREILGIDVFGIFTGNVPGYTMGGIFASIKQYHQANASNHVLKKGLTSWNKSSIYRDIIGKARLAGRTNVLTLLATLIYAEVKCIIEEWNVYSKGGCQP